MSTSLDSIWDEPLLNSPPRTPARQKTPSALFLDEHDDSNKDQDANREPMDIDKLFEGLDDDIGNIKGSHKDSSSQPFDIDAYRKKARERAAKEVASDPTFSKYAVQSSSPPRTQSNEKLKKKKDEGGDKEADEPKQKKKVMRLDEDRLLSKDGFPALIQQVKEFKPKGKGHEVSDLNRLMNIYQYWAHSLNPKIQFSDTVQRVEKLCHTKRMTVSLHVWQDDFHGTINGVPRETLEDHGSDRESENEPDGAAKEQANSQVVSVHANGSSRAPSSEPNELESGRVSRPPSSVADPLTDADDNLFDDDIDLDAIFDEPQAGSKLGGSTHPAPSSKPSQVEDEDVDMWAAEYEAMGEEIVERVGSKATKASVQIDEDEDAWEAMLEAETRVEGSGEKDIPPSTADRQVVPVVSARSGVSPAPTTDPVLDAQTHSHHDDLDDMYV